MATFTWQTDPELPLTVQVEAIMDPDEWTARELREVERVIGPADTFMSTFNMILCVSVARAVPGATVRTVDERLTIGLMNRLLAELNAARDTEAPAEEPAETADPGAVLSPISADG
jgi:hypothetical protein